MASGGMIQADNDNYDDDKDEDDMNITRPRPLILLSCETPCAKLASEQSWFQGK